MTPSRTLTVAQLVPEARDQSVLALSREAALEAAYVRPGQYCLLTVPDTQPPIEGHFALIDPPGTGAPLRFLLRAGGPAADALRKVPVGRALGVSAPLGDGFAVERAEGHDVLLVCAGAGIAAIRPLLLSMPPTPTRRVWLYHGTRTVAHVPFGRDLEAAQGRGVHITITVSQGPGIDTITGRVQHAIERDKPDLSNAVAFLSGMTAMLDVMRATLPRFGLRDDRFFLNY